MLKKISQTIKHTGFRRYFINTSWMFLGQMFSLIISFFVGAWVARYLGPSNYGLVSYTLAFVGIFGFIADLGIYNTINRELIKNPEKNYELMGTGFMIKLIGGSIAFFAVTISTFLLKINFFTKILIVLFALTFIIQAFNIVSNYFQSNVKSKSNVIAQVISSTISALLKIILILTRSGVTCLIAIYVLDVLLLNTFAIIAYYKQGLTIKKWRVNHSLMWKLLKDSWPLMLSAAASYIYLKIDQVIIGQLLDIQSVGYYAAAVKISEILYIIPGIICTSLFPAIINAQKTSSTLYHKRLMRLYWLMLIISIGSSLLITFLSKTIITVLFGALFSPSIPILNIYTWSSVGLFLGTAVTQYLLAENRTRLIFNSNLGAMIANITLNFILIPIIGMRGAAIATLISYLIVPASAFIYLKIKKQWHAATIS